MPFGVTIILSSHPSSQPPTSIRLLSPMPPNRTSSTQCLSQTNPPSPVNDATPSISNSLSNSYSHSTNSHSVPLFWLIIQISVYFSTITLINKLI